MKKLLLIGLVILAGCREETIYVDANGQRTQAPEDIGLEALYYKKSADMGIQRTCMDGIVYVTYGTGISVGYKPDGTPAHCKGSQIK